MSAEQRASRLDEAMAVALDVEVLAVDVFAGLGLDTLEAALTRGRTLAFVGSGRRHVRHAIQAKSRERNG